MVPNVINNQRGYTMIEVVSTLVVANIGFFGILMLARVLGATVTASVDTTKAVACANHVAKHLQSDALSWVDPGNFTSIFPTVPNVANPSSATDTSPGATSGWRVYVYDTDNPNYMPEVCDVFGFGARSTIARTTDATNPVFINQKFCVHYNLTWLIPDFAIRTDIRVMWPQDDAELANWSTCPYNANSNPDAGTSMELAYDEVNSVTLTNVIMRNTSVRR